MDTIEIRLYPVRREKVIKCLDMIKTHKGTVFTFIKPGWQYDEHFLDTDPNESPYEIATLLLGTRYSLSNPEGSQIPDIRPYYRTLSCLFIEYLVYHLPDHIHLILIVSGEMVLPEMQRLRVERLSIRIE